MMKTFYTILLCFCFALSNYAQSNYRLIEKGNRAYNKEQYSESEIAYRKALEQDNKLTTAQFNIGNARYAQGDFEAAATKFQQSAEAYIDKLDKAEAYHNLGNSLMSMQKYEESIEAYKNALKLNPTDQDTKYNLAYAQQMLKKEEEQQQQNQEQEDKNEQQEENKNQNSEEQEEKDKNGEPEDEKDQEQEKGDENPDQEKGENEKPEQAKDGKLTKEQADQILKMLEGEEAKLQEKLDEPEGEIIQIRGEKDW